MSETFRCDDKETLVAYLYDEIDAARRREVERHLRGCPACTRETGELQDVRHDLTSWVPPEVELGFSIAQKPSPVVRPARWAALHELPRWAQVAAAALVIAAGAALANVQVRFGPEGVTVSTGWIAPAPVVPDPAPLVASSAEAAPSAPSEDAWRPALVALEESLRAEFAQMQRASAADAVPARSTDTAAVFRRMQAMLDASEQRQRQELAVRLAQADRDWNMKRQADLMRINQSFGTLQGRTFKNEAGQQEMMNYLRRVSVQPIP
jgi:hypothetical protein